MNSFDRIGSTGIVSTDLTKNGIVSTGITSTGIGSTGIVSTLVHIVTTYSLEFLHTLLRNSLNFY